MKKAQFTLVIRFTLLSTFIVGIILGIRSEIPIRHDSVSQTTTLPNIPAGETGVVDRVVDGDTIKVMLNGEEKTVRLIGINTPETVDPQTPVQCYGPEASAYAKTLLTNKTVTMTDDTSQQDMDHYGRLLRYVYLDQLFVNREMVRLGYAHEYTYDRPYAFRNEFLSVEKEARNAGLGLWSACPQS